MHVDLKVPDRSNSLLHTDAWERRNAFAHLVCAVQAWNLCGILLGQGCTRETIPSALRHTPPPMMTAAASLTTADASLSSPRSDAAPDVQPGCAKQHGDSFLPPPEAVLWMDSGMKCSRAARQSLWIYGHPDLTSVLAVVRHRLRPAGRPHTPDSSLPTSDCRGSLPRWEVLFFFTFWLPTCQVGPWCRSMRMELARSWRLVCHI